MIVPDAAPTVAPAAMTPPERRISHVRGHSTLCGHLADFRQETLEQQVGGTGDSGAAGLTLGRPAAHDVHMDLGRISVDHRIMGGVPCVAGTRIPVATVVGLVANGLTADEIVAEYPQLTCR